MEAAQSEFDAVVKERADKEAAKAAEVKRLAEEELDGFYDERTDEVSTVGCSKRLSYLVLPPAEIVVLKEGPVPAIIPGW